jgi:hypothetical protein
LNFQRQLPALDNTSSPPAWLALSTEQLGNALDQYARTNRPSEEQLLAALRATRTVEVRIPDEPAITNTVLRVEGPLASRRVTSLPHLPSAPYTDVLPRTTVVAVSVNGEGIVETASLAEESGLDTADARAVDLARLVQLEALPVPDARVRASASPTLGRFIFTWHVASPTNGSPATGGARIPR